MLLEQIGQQNEEIHHLRRVLFVLRHGSDTLATEFLARLRLGATVKELSEMQTNSVSQATSPWCKPNDGTQVRSHASGNEIGRW